MNDDERTPIPPAFENVEVPSLSGPAPDPHACDHTHCVACERAMPDEEISHGHHEACCTCTYELPGALLDSMTDVEGCYSVSLVDGSCFLYTGGARFTGKYVCLRLAKYLTITGEEVMVDNLEVRVESIVACWKRPRE